MSSRNNNNNNNQGRNGSNRIRGPTSALSSFLREHGIRVENRSRRARRERAAEPEQPAAEAFSASEANTPTPNDDAAAESTDQQATTAILYTPSGRQRRAASGAANRAIVEAAKKRKKKDDDSDDDYRDEDEGGPAAGPSSSRRSQAGRTRIFFCSRCKGRYARAVDDAAGQENVCPSCLENKPIDKSKRPKKKRAVQRKGNQQGDANLVPTLQDLCIDVIAKYIENVEALGDISFINMDKLAKIICRNRQLNNHTARLFMEPVMRDLALYDCTGVDETGLMNIAQFCPRLQKLKLIYCGKITDAVIDAYADRLKDLRSLELSGSYLVTSAAWESFFEKTGDRLESFSISHSMRFTHASLQALTKHARKLKHLRLMRLVKMEDTWLDDLHVLKHLETLELSWPSSERNFSSAAITKLVQAVGNGLTELALRGCTEVDDKVLEAIREHCPNLHTLKLAQCESITSAGVQTLFTEWKTQWPGQGLKYLDLSRCVLLEDDALLAIVRHSYKSLEHLDIHSLENITASALEALSGKEGLKNLQYLDCGFVRSMDDFVLKSLMDGCPLLTQVKVWGCHQVTDSVPIRRGLMIQGRES
ncbi:uncharacterized protein BYT42DRAFT_583832 [Radiomyces spectabilis]|uniref:uncharacterized protein n=1 Tax=Radiomyces spectabilis TaxID=64574 RepID=UPI0022205CB7|nr:uncharacterized protein BYT42DRAFT_583832 [Radiomyces spectabilis]KAI8369300.1 hypothetical protein BYT42DRAFT_583832 [Radiomyces spectabilis]